MTSSPLPPATGIGLRSPHVRQVLDERPAVPWLEIHSENYYVDGGPVLVTLDRIRDDYPLSLHGVGMSLGSTDPLDRTHLAKLARLIERTEPALVSEHLCWSGVGGRVLNDLLPLPYTEEAARVLARQVSEAQEFLGRQLLIENVSAYVTFADSQLNEWDFLGEVVARSGCALLLDVNNVYVSACNLGLDASAYIAGLPRAAVREIHLAGHARNGTVLIDNHGSRVCEAVWDLYRQAIARFGPVPTLVEWDTDIPPLATLVAESARADQLLEECRGLAA